MKVLHLSTYEMNGGAAIAARRLHDGLTRYHVESYMLVCGTPKLSDSLTTSPFSKKARNLGKIYHIARYMADNAPLKILAPKSSRFFSINYIPSRVATVVQQIKPDIIHLHWINDGFFNLRELEAMDIPIVWSFHDMWGITGGCHYDNGCKKWQSHCEACPLLNSRFKKDIAYFNFKEKKRIYQNIRQFTIIGLSKWMKDECNASPLLLGKRIINLPNCLNTGNFNNISREDARKKLKLPTSKHILLFGAMSLTDPRKGFIKLSEALELLDNSDNYLLLSIGGHQPTFPTAKNIIPLGKISDQQQMNLLYSAADVTILPSLQENLSNMIMESMANATPVVAFNIGGNPDMIKHKENGYLAEAGNSNDLTAGIEWILAQNQNRHISSHARKTIETSFDEKIVIPRYIELYSNLMSQKK